MKPWMKVVLGCFAVGVIGLFLLIAGLIGFTYWAKNRFEEAAGGGPAVEAARKTANAVPFTRPPGNAVSEPRLVKFIEVRASVFSVYEKYRGEIESRVTKVKEGKSLDLSDFSTGLTFMGELQKAETMALAQHAMSEDEYGFIAGEVYKAMWSELGGGEAGKKAIREAADAARSAARAVEAGGSGLPPEAREGLAKAAEEMATGARGASVEIENIRTSPENAALFKKYEADLKKYAMPGLTTLFKDESRTPPAPSSKRER